jgi:hypothetical protein
MDWSTRILRLRGAEEPTRHLTVVDEVDGQFAEFGFAACEAWACPVEDAVFESECGAD